MSTTDSANACLFMGATGRVGRLVTRAFDLIEPQPFPLIHQSRQLHDAGSDNVLHWSPLDGPEPLIELTRATGPFKAIMVFVGATPGQSQDMMLNVSLTQAVLVAAAEAGIMRLLVASSSAVYGAGLQRAYKETDDLAPLNAYGEAKAMMEAACDPWRERGLEICSLRIGNVAGADALLKQLGRTERIDIDQFSDGQGPERSYLGPRTLAQVLVSLTTHRYRLPSVLNVAAPKPVYMSDLATAAGLNWQYAPSRSAEVTQSITIDCDRLTKLHEFSSDDPKASYMVGQIKELT